MNTTIQPIPQGFDYSAIERADLAETTKAKYKREIENLRDAGISPLDYEALEDYAAGLKSSRKSFLKSALRLMADGYKNRLQAGATPANLAAVDAGLHRLEAMQSAIKVKAHKGTKAHIWLAPAQVKQITSLCGDDIEGKRDWIVLGLLLGAGLRRDELVSLTFDALKQQPTKTGKMRDVLEIKGKGDKTRVIPIKPILADRLREWEGIVGGGLVARSLGRSKELGESISAVAVFHIVRKYGEMIGVPELAPHDLRRTFAQLGYDAGVPITQISTLLGHSTVAVTQKYLNLALDLESTASDFIPLAGD
jgi:integrase